MGHAKKQPGIPKGNPSCFFLAFRRRAARRKPQDRILFGSAFSIAIPKIMWSYFVVSPCFRRKRQHPAFQFLFEAAIL
jgi:hypothetical protein